METNLPFQGKAVKTLLLAILMLMGIMPLEAQDNPLNRKITLRVQEEQLGEALVLMGQKGAFSFAYNSDLFPEDSIVSIRARQESVREVLDGLFEGTVAYKPVGNHVVLRLEAKKAVEDPEWIEVTGYLIDGETGDPLRYATVYEAAKHKSVLTKEDGSYTIQVPGQVKTVPISFSKVGYHDTVVVIRPKFTDKLSVGLLQRPQVEVDPIAVSLLGDSEEEDPLPLADLFVPEYQQQRAFNIRAALASFPVQISLVPSLGTNGLMSGGMTNNFSLNILAGYSNGVKGFEVGGLANINREDMIGAQVGGLANVVGGNVVGFQAGGISNHVRGSMMGFQVGGLYNTVRDSVYGIQVGGLANRVKGHVTGIQVAGLWNRAAQDVMGMQIGGLSNLAKGEVQLLQVAGLFNRGTDIGGFQVAGLTNRAKGKVGGFQIAGIYNSAQDTVGGFQVSGIANRAGHVKGFQIGLVNIADTLDGFAIGLVNISKNGYKSIGVGTSDVNDVQVTLRTGREYLYSILSVGTRLRSNRHKTWSYGGGIGTSMSLAPALRLELEAWVEQVNEEFVGPDRLNLVTSLRPGLTLRPLPWLELNAGAAVNLGISNTLNSAGEFISDIPRSPFYSEDHGNTQLSGWIGYQGGLRIRF